MFMSRKKTSMNTKLLPLIVSRLAMVMVASTQRSTRTCLWGELLSTASVARGANGAIIDGYTRDVRLIQKMQFPVFSTGMYPVDSAGRGMVTAYNITINCGGVVVHPGDIIFGDIDGIVVIPKDAAREVIERAVEKVKGENITRDELKNGATLRRRFLISMEYCNGTI